MISATSWVPRGYASEFPEEYELDDSEMERINAMASLQLAEQQQEEEEQEEQEDKPTQLQDQIELDDDLKEYDLEHYDDDVEDKEGTGEQVTVFPGLSGTDAAYHDGEDPYLSLPNENDQLEEKAENQIYPTDNLVLATRTEDDISYLDVYVYDDGAGAPEGAEEEEEDKFDQDVAKGLVRDKSLYVHHDIMLPAFPLCVEWISYRNDKADNIGNMAAIGTFDPQIEIWNLDCPDKAFPDAILGEPQDNSISALKKKKKGKKKKGSAVDTHHTDAVLSLAHNRIHRHVLASTSADHTVKLWDLTTATAATSLNDVHSGKTVSSSHWHSTEAHVLLTGGYDAAGAVTDVRSSETKRYKVGKGEEVETVSWGQIPEVFYTGTDNGNVYCFDVRQDKPLWTLHAHDSGISSLNVNSHIGGMFATAAMGEKVVKVWKAPSNANPSMVISRDFGVGNVLTSSFAGDIEVAGNLVIGGATGGLKMWDVLSNRSVRNTFKDELREMQQRARVEAKQHGKASRIARKYAKDANEESIMVVDTNELDESDSDHEDPALEDENED